MKTHTGGCHCGAVRFEAKGEFKNVMECNCSHCAKKGFHLSFIPASEFKLICGGDNLTEYRFNKKQIQHLFCKTCGVQSFGKGSNSKGEETAMVNVRCLDDVNPETLKVTKVDGNKY